MTTNISEKSFKELNTLMSEVNVQMEELNRRKEEISAAIQSKKEQVVSDFVLHSNQYMEAYRQMMEDTRLMMEMGIDPTSISTEPAIEDKVEEPLVVPSEDVVEEEVAGHVSAEPDVLQEELEEETSDAEIIEDVDTDDTTSIDVKEEDKCSEPNELKKGGYKPFFYLLGKRNGAFPKNGTTNKIRKSTRLLTPFYKLVGNGPINRSLPMGNLKYRDSYPNPDESRIYSADGIAPTITAMHSDLHIWVGPRLDTPTEPTPLTDAA